MGCSHSAEERLREPAEKSGGVFPKAVQDDGRVGMQACCEVTGGRPGAWTVVTRSSRWGGGQARAVLEGGEFPGRKE